MTETRLQTTVLPKFPLLNTLSLDAIFKLQ